MTEGKGFSHFLELPPKLRMMMINKMEPEERCRLTGCSKSSNKEAKTSKNYIHGLTFKSFGIHLFIHVIHGISIGSDDEPESRGFILRFEKDEDEDNHNQYMKCINFRDDVLWMTEINSSENLFQFAFEHFKSLLQMYQKIVKELKIYVKDSIVEQCDIDFGTTSLKNLKELAVYDDIDIRQFLSKTVKGLERLTVSEQRNGKINEGCDEIYQVNEELEAPHTQLNNQQFLRLSAPEIYIHIGQLTEHDIFNFVQSWQNDTIGKKVKRYRWNLQDSNFNVGKMFELFGEEHVDSDEVEIKHNIETDKRALLVYSPVRWLSRTIFFEEIC